MPPQSGLPPPSSLPLQCPRGLDSAGRRTGVHVGDPHHWTRLVGALLCVGHLHHRTWLVGAPECVQVASAGGHTGVCVDDRHRMWLVGAPECVSVTCILGLGWRVRIIGLDWSAHWSTCWRPSSDVAGGRTATRVCDLHHRTQLVGAPECASVNIIGRAHTFTDRAPTGRLCTFLD